MKKKEKSALITIIIVSIAFPIISIVVFRLMSGGFSGDYFVPVLGGVFLGAGTIMVIWRVIKVIVSNKQCPETVMATCIDLHSQSIAGSGSDNTITTYLPVFEYSYNGLEYKSSPKDVYNNIDVLRVGEKYRIKVNPLWPEQIYYPMVKTFFTFLVSGLVFIFFGVLVLYAWFYL